MRDRSSLNMSKTEYEHIVFEEDAKFDEGLDGIISKNLNLH